MVRRRSGIRCNRRTARFAAFITASCLFLLSPSQLKRLGVGTTTDAGGNQIDKATANEIFETPFMKRLMIHSMDMTLKMPPHLVVEVRKRTAANGSSEHGAKSSEDAATHIPEALKQAQGLYHWQGRLSGLPAWRKDCGTHSICYDAHMSSLRWVLHPSGITNKGGYLAMSQSKAHLYGKEPWTLVAPGQTSADVDDAHAARATATSSDTGKDVHDYDGYELRVSDPSEQPDLGQRCLEGAARTAMYEGGLCIINEEVPRRGPAKGGVSSKAAAELPATPEYRDLLFTLLAHFTGRWDLYGRPGFPKPPFEHSQEGKGALAYGDLVEVISGEHAGVVGYVLDREGKGEDLVRISVLEPQTHLSPNGNGTDYATLEGERADDQSTTSAKEAGAAWRNADHEADPHIHQQQQQQPRYWYCSRDDDRGGEGEGGGESIPRGGDRVEDIINRLSLRPSSSSPPSSPTTRRAADNNKAGGQVKPSAAAEQQQQQQQHMEKQEKEDTLPQPRRIEGTPCPKPRFARVMLVKARECLRKAAHESRFMPQPTLSSAADDDDAPQSMGDSRGRVASIPSSSSSSSSAAASSPPFFYNVHNNATIFSNLSTLEREIYLAAWNPRIAHSVRRPDRWTALNDKLREYALIEGKMELPLAGAKRLMRTASYVPHGWCGAAVLMKTHTRFPRIPAKTAGESLVARRVRDRFVTPKDCRTLISAAILAMRYTARIGPRTSLPFPHPQTKALVGERAVDLLHRIQKRTKKSISADFHAQGDLRFVGGTLTRLISEIPQEDALQVSEDTRYWDLWIPTCVARKDRRFYKATIFLNSHMLDMEENEEDEEETEGKEEEGAGEEERRSIQGDNDDPARELREEDGDGTRQESQSCDRGFRGGRIVFVDDDANRVVFPVQGRLLLQKMTLENLHYTERVTDPRLDRQQMDKLYRFCADGFTRVREASFRIDMWFDVKVQQSNRTMEVSPSLRNNNDNLME